MAIKTIQYVDLRTDFERGVALLARALRGEADAALPTPVRGKITGVDTLRVTLPYLMSVPLSGRDDDLNALRAGLGSARDPHVTQIVAVGGTGKSRVAAELALDYPNGAIWHRCTKASKAYEMTELIRQHYGLDEKVSPELVLASLDDAPPLIVIDNAEDVDPDTERRAAYAELAARIATRGVPVVLTARAAWSEMRPFRPHDLVPLTIEPAVRIALDFAAAEGIELAEDRARELAAAGRLHPRLIEFAVRQLHARGFERVKRQLEDLKQAGVQDALDEMIFKTMRQMVEQARGGVGAEQVLHHLTVFEGPFDWDAALALRPAGMDEGALDEALVTLQGWGFVRFDKVSERYTINEVVREALPTDEECHARHFDYYFARHGDFDANNNEDRHPSITRDWAELRAALRWGNEQRPGDSVALAWALHYFMQLRAPKVEWRSVIESAHEAANQADDRLGQANTLQGLGDVARMQNEYEPARDYYERAFALGTQIGDFPVRLNCLWQLGRLERALGNMEAACEFFRRALALADSHPFFKTHPLAQRWRDEYTALGCDAELNGPAQHD
ncbi:MAG: tetratricopeptide repeat protein [Anaerolineae bacterium]|nr:tetratricopeptide repeat protein [Anaerolineae bacterium]